MQLHKKLLITILAVGAFFLACQKELSFESSGQISGPGEWQFQQGTPLYKGTMDTAFIEDVSGVKVLSLQGSTADGTGDLFIQVFGSAISVGTYKTPFVLFEYDKNGSPYYSNDPTALNQFTLVITAIDSLHVTGTFTGQVLDSANALKTITAGTFTGRFKTVAPPPVTGNLCKIRDLAYYDLSSGTVGGTYASTFTGSQVTKVQWIDSSATPATINNTFNVTYPTNQVKVDANQFFLLNTDGTVKTFHGYFDPTDTTSPRIVVNYTYDGNGYMTQSTLAPETAPTIIVFQTTYGWTGGNLTKVVDKDLIDTTRTETVYAYDGTKMVRNFLYFQPQSEILLFQSAINAGKTSLNLVTKSTMTDYDSHNTASTPDVANFSAVTDANNYVQNFSITGGNSIYGSGVKYVLSYKCF